MKRSLTPKRSDRAQRNIRVIQDIDALLAKGYNLSQAYGWAAFYEKISVSTACQIYHKKQKYGIHV